MIRNLGDGKFVLNIIVLTYKRNHELLRCLHSLIAAKNNCDLTAQMIISIFDNDPDNDIEEKIGNIDTKIDTTINYQKRDFNLGPRKNFIDSLIESHRELKPDGHIYVSDDDYVLPEFISENIKTFLAGNDASISSCFVHDDTVNGEYSYIRHRVRRVPTRQYTSDEKIKQFITDSRLLTGTAYSGDLLDSVLECDDKTRQFIEQLWYPMAFLSSFSKNPCFISKPIFVHTQNNKTHWGDFNAYEEFFLGRIDMFKKMEHLDLVPKKEVEDLILDFIGHQSAKRIIRYISSNRLSFNHVIRIAYISIVRKMILERVPNLLEAMTRKLAYILGNFRKI